MTPLLLLAATLSAPPAPQAVAFVLESKGEVAVERDGKASPLDDGDPLRPGDKLRVPAGGGVKVYFRPAGPVAALEGPATGTVEATKIATEATVALRDAALPTQSAEKLSRDLADGKMGGMVLRGAASSVRPVDGSAVLAERPVFSWPAAPGATEYAVKLFLGPPGASRRQYWAATTAETSLTYPADARPLRRGETATYHWEVTATTPAGPKAVGGGQFTAPDAATVGAEKLAALAASADSSDWVLAAEAYASGGFLDEATKQYERVAAARPQSAGAWRALARLYARAGDEAKAKAAEAKAGR